MHLKLTVGIVIAAIVATVPSRAVAQSSVTQSVLIGDDDGFGGTQGADSNPGDSYSNFSNPAMAPGTHVGVNAIDKTTESPWTPYVFEFSFDYDASSFVSLSAATVTIQTGSVGRRSDGSGFGFASVEADPGAGAIALGELLTTDTGGAGSPLEESVKAHEFDVLPLVTIAGPSTLLIRIDGSGLASPVDQFAIDFARLDLTGTPAGGPALTGLTLKKPTVAGCKPMTGTVTLSAPAPSGGLVVLLSESLASASAPASVTIPTGATSQKFRVTTTPVGVSEQGIVTASYGATTLMKPLTVRPISVLSVSLTPNPVVGGSPASGLVKLECKAEPASILVELGSSNPGVASPTVPNVQIAKGTQTAIFMVTTADVSATATPKITAKANGLTKAKKLTVTP